MEVGDSAVEEADFAGVEVLLSAMEGVHPMIHSERGRNLHHSLRNRCESEEEQGATVVVRGECRLTGGWVLAAVGEEAPRVLPEVAKGGPHVMRLVSESHTGRPRECCHPRYAPSCETSGHLCGLLQMQSPCRNPLRSQSHPRYGQDFSVVPLLDGRGVQL